MLLHRPRRPVYPFWRCFCKVPADERECEGPTSSAPVLESSSLLTVLLTFQFSSSFQSSPSSQVLEDLELKGRCGDLSNQRFVPHTVCVRSRLSACDFCVPFDQTPERQLQINTGFSEISALSLESQSAQQPSFPSSSHFCHHFEALLAFTILLPPRWSSFCWGTLWAPNLWNSCGFRAPEALSYSSSL